MGARFSSTHVAGRPRQGTPHMGTSGRARAPMHECVGVYGCTPEREWARRGHTWGRTWAHTLRHTLTHQGAHESTCAYTCGMWADTLRMMAHRHAHVDGHIHPGELRALGHGRLRQCVGAIDNHALAMRASACPYAIVTRMVRREGTLPRQLTRQNRGRVDAHVKSGATRFGRMGADATTHAPTKSSRTMTAGAHRRTHTHTPAHIPVHALTHAPT